MLRALPVLDGGELSVPLNLFSPAKSNFSPSRPTVGPLLVLGVRVWRLGSRDKGLGFRVVRKITGVLEKSWVVVVGGGVGEKWQNIGEKNSMVLTVDVESRPCYWYCWKRTELILISRVKLLAYI